MMNTVIVEVLFFMVNPFDLIVKRRCLAGGDKRIPTMASGQAALDGFTA